MLIRPFRRVLLAALTAMSLVGLALPAHAVVLKEQQDAGVWHTNGGVWGSAQYHGALGDILFVGGRFTKVRELPPGTPGGATYDVSGLAAFDMTTGQGIPSFTPLVSGVGSQKNEVHALAVVGDVLYVGGQFGQIDGEGHYNLAAIDIPAAMDGNPATPAVISSFNPTVGIPGASNENKFFVYEIAPAGDGMYIGGAFSKVNGKGRPKLAKVAYDGNLVTAFRAGPINGAVRDVDLATDGASIFVGGAFSTVASQSRNAIVRLDAVTGALHPWVVPSGTLPTGSSGRMTCWDVQATSSRLFAGCGRGPNYAIGLRLDDGNSGARTFIFNTAGNVQAVGLATDGDLFIGGHFGTNLGFSGSLICSSRPDGAKRLKAFGILHNVQGTGDAESIECSFLPQFWGPNGFGGVWEIQVAPDGKVWVTGEFHEINCPQGLGQCENQWGVARFSPV